MDVYAEENADDVWKDFSIAMEINGDANGDEVYNINNNNVQDDAGKKDNQDKNKANDDHDHKYIEYDDKQDDAAKWTIKTKIKHRRPRIHDHDHNYFNSFVVPLHL